MNTQLSKWLAIAGLALQLLPASLTAQSTHEIDSLLLILDQHPDADTNRLQALETLGALYQDVDNAKAIPFYTQSAGVAQALKNDVSEWRAYYNIGYSNLSMGQYEPAAENYLKALRIAEKHQYVGRLANTYLSLGNVFLEMGNAKKAGIYHEQAAAVYIAHKDTVGLAAYYNERALVFSKGEKYDSAEWYFNKSLELSIAAGDGLMQADAYSNLALNYKKQQRYKEALQLFKKALYLGPQYYNTPDYLAALYNNLGAGYMVNNLYDSARQAFHTSIHYSMISGSAPSEMENYRNLGQLYEAMHQPDSQLLYVQKYYALKDSLENNSITVAITQKEADFHIEKKQDEIEKQKATRNWLLVLTALCMLAAGAVYFAWRQTQRNNQRLLKLNEHISAQKDQLEKLNALKDRLMSIISHDLRNPLATIQTFFDLSTQANLPPEQLKPLQQHTSQVVQRTSQMLDNLLVWAQLQIKNEQPKLSTINACLLVNEVVLQVSSQAEKKNVTIQTHISAEPIRVQGQDELLRIVTRNLLTNAIKFSQPQSVIAVRLAAENDAMVLSIEDEGIGMSPDQVRSLMQQGNQTTKGTHNESGSGLGVFLVHELLRPMKGKMEIESAQNQGSIFRIIIPTVQLA